MMRIIVITDTPFAASEAESIRILLSEGADRVHLRKPQSAENDMRRLIEALPPELYPRLTLQDHLYLAGEYGIGGVHLNARNPEIPAGFGGLISRSCHSFEELASHPTEDYLFSARSSTASPKPATERGMHRTNSERHSRRASSIRASQRSAASGRNTCPRYRSMDSGERPFSGTSGRALRPKNWCGACGKYENSTDKPAENHPEIGLINNNTLMYLLESTAHQIPSEKEQGKVGITGSAKSRDNRSPVRRDKRQTTVH